MAEAKLEEYCLLAKGSKGRTLADVVQRAISDPVLFAFGELLAVPSVQQVGVDVEISVSCFLASLQKCNNLDLLARSCLKPIRLPLTEHCSFSLTEHGEPIRVRSEPCIVLRGSKPIHIARAFLD